MEMDRPTAADYARADIHTATQSVEQMATQLRVTEAKLALAELKLTALGFLAEELEQETYDDAWVTCVATHRTMRAIMGVSSAEEFLALREG